MQASETLMLSYCLEQKIKGTFQILLNRTDFRFGIGRSHCPRHTTKGYLRVKGDYNGRHFIYMPIVCINTLSVKAFHRTVI